MVHSLLREGERPWGESCYSPLLPAALDAPAWPCIPSVPYGTHLGGRGVKDHIEEVGFLAGAAGTKDTIGAFCGVLQHHDLPGDSSRAGWGGACSTCLGTHNPSSLGSPPAPL